MARLQRRAPVLAPAALRRVWADQPSYSVSLAHALSGWLAQSVSLAHALPGWHNPCSWRMLCLVVCVPRLTTGFSTKTKPIQCPSDRFVKHDQTHSQHANLIDPSNMTKHIANMRTTPFIINFRNLLRMMASFNVAERSRASRMERKENIVVNIEGRRLQKRFGHQVGKAKSKINYEGACSTASERASS